ncbi:MAG TPA: hypothetical protein VFD43_04135, partial [Planctomycetota bacterium]|nr:hypothetical protein [Planctomycetota bacterium]
MRTPSRTALVHGPAAALLALIPALAACQARDTGSPQALRPPPTEHWLSPDAEAANKQKRKAWIESLHRAPPDVDWRQIERRNGEQQREKRNRLAAMAAVASRWTERGSANQAGRMHTAARGPDGATLYGGSALGGVWRGTLDGQDWTPIGDNIYGGAHWLAVVPGESPADPDVVLRATDGGLIDVTRDGGATWTVPAGLPTTIGVRRVLTLSDGSHRIYLLLHHYTVLGQQRYSLYRSTNAAQSFSSVASLGTYAGDVWAPRDGGSTLYLLAQGQLRRSLDGGATWSDVGPTPAGSSGGELVASEAGAPRFWAALNQGGSTVLHRSEGGAGWTQVATLSDYWGSLNASMLDADLFAYGGVEVWRTTDGGGGFAKVNGWGDYYGDPAHKLHADIPGIDVLPDGLGGEIWYVSTDGGLYRSADGLASVSNLSLDGLRVSQYYTTHTSSANPTHVVAGSQDQGYQRASAAPGPGGLLEFDQLISGDYGHATSGNGTHAYVYSVYPGFILAQKGETSPQLYFVDFPAAEDYGWLPTITADPANVERFFFCASHLYRYRKTTLIPPSWTVSQWSAFDFGIGAGEYLSALDFSPADGDRVYAATSWGRLYVSTDHGVTWTAGGGSAPED